MSTEFYEAMKNKSDEEYRELLYRTILEDVIDGVKMPRFPSVEIQAQFVGTSGPATLQGEAWTFYQLVKGYVSIYSEPIGADTTILDFGCNWGRTARLFFKDTNTHNVYGLDVDYDVIQECKNTLPYGTFEVCSSAPPSTFEDNFFNVIYAYSFFAHFKDDTALKWMEEFSRILKPGGLLIATTNGERFLNHCKELQERAKHQPLDHYSSILMHSFDPLDESIRRYRNGEFLYAPIGGGGVRHSSYYGASVIPKEFIENEFGQYLKLKHFSVDNGLVHSVFVMQK